MPFRVATSVKQSNAFSTKDLPTFAGVSHTPLRNPYWLDDSYVAETFLIRNRAG